MARKRSTQTAPGHAVYRVNETLRVPISHPDEPVRYITAGSEATSDELAGLVLPALEEGGLIKKISEATYACELCQEQGNAEEKAATYSAKELADHYGEAHPGYAAPEGKE